MVVFRYLCEVFAGGLFSKWLCALCRWGPGCFSNRFFDGNTAVLGFSNNCVAILSKGCWAVSGILSYSDYLLWGHLSCLGGGRGETHYRGILIPSVTVWQEIWGRRFEIAHIRTSQGHYVLPLRALLRTNRVMFCNSFVSECTRLSGPLFLIVPVCLFIVRIIIQCVISNHKRQAFSFFQWRQVAHF